MLWTLYDFKLQIFRHTKGNFLSQKEAGVVIYNRRAFLQLATAERCSVDLAFLKRNILQKWMSQLSCPPLSTN